MADRWYTGRRLHDPVKVGCYFCRVMKIDGRMITCETPHESVLEPVDVSMVREIKYLGELEQLHEIESSAAKLGRGFLVWQSRNSSGL